MRLLKKSMQREKISLSLDQDSRIHEETKMKQSEIPEMLENKKEDCYGNKVMGFSRLTVLKAIKSFSKCE